MSGYLHCTHCRAIHPVELDTCPSCGAANEALPVPEMTKPKVYVVTYCTYDACEPECAFSSEAEANRYADKRNTQFGPTSREGVFVTELELTKEQP